MHTLVAENFDTWRDQARDMLARNIPPSNVSWSEGVQQGLFGEPPLRCGVINGPIAVPKEFFSLAEAVGCHRDPRRWDLLYQVLWRLTHGEKNLLRITTDPLMHALHIMKKAVRRDAHKMKAFVRFRLVEEDGRQHYIAWHRPDHKIVRRVAPFFSRRFGPMEWTILTPDQSVHWDGAALSYGPGAAVEDAPQGDALEELWRTYYRNIFNPARIKIKAMKREMPVRHWHTLPETRIIQDMLNDAPRRVEDMLKHSEGLTISAENFLPADRALPSLKEAAKTCEGCELHRHATQTVFGEGPLDAPLMIVGEQPGNDEDIHGRPFIGPAGEMLDEALHQAGLSRLGIYITNAVKHFRFLYKESFRHHRAPSADHMRACRPWLNAEIAAIKPKAILCLGNTAARTLISPGFTMKTGRGAWVEGTAPALLASYHPAAILRAQDGERQTLKHYLINDIGTAARYAMAST